MNPMETAGFKPWPAAEKITPKSKAKLPIEEVAKKAVRPSSNDSPPRIKEKKPKIDKVKTSLDAQTTARTLKEAKELIPSLQKSATLKIFKELKTIDLIAKLKKVGTPESDQLLMQMTNLKVSLFLRLKSEMLGVQPAMPKNAASETDILSRNKELVSTFSQYSLIDLFSKGDGKKLVLDKAIDEMKGIRLPEADAVLNDLKLLKNNVALQDKFYEIIKFTQKIKSPVNKADFERHVAQVSVLLSNFDRAVDEANPTKQGHFYTMAQSVALALHKTCDEDKAAGMREVALAEGKRIFQSKLLKTWDKPESFSQQEVDKMTTSLAALKALPIQDKEVQSTISKLTQAKEIFSFFKEKRAQLDQLNDKLKIPANRAEMNNTAEKISDLMIEFEKPLSVGELKTWHKSCVNQFKKDFAQALSVGKEKENQLDLAVKQPLYAEIRVLREETLVLAREVVQAKKLKSKEQYDVLTILLAVTLTKMNEKEAVLLKYNEERGLVALKEDNQALNSLLEIKNLCKNLFEVSNQPDPKEGTRWHQIQQEGKITDAMNADVIVRKSAAILLRKLMQYHLLPAAEDTQAKKNLRHQVVGALTKLKETALDNRNMWQSIKELKTKEGILLGKNVEELAAKLGF